MKSAGSRLSALTKQLALDWDQTKTSWQDAKAAEFEQKFLSELFASVEKTVAVIDQLDKLTSNIRKDCE